mmetsp:Transcript_17466/g.28689  ORF Transcript_17466/g.28689 Transcript_17466/m.28689 type:complete len:223 (+) Transcript_17466:53-721(+)
MAASRPIYVLLYVPNLIGYARIGFMIASVVYAFSNYWLCFWFYTIAHLLDAADGYAARLLGQSSKIGAVLDMVTDRIATAGFLMILSHLYKEHTLHLTLLLYLDIGSHWFHTYSSFLRSSSSHKAITKAQSFFLRLYYHSRLVLGGMCLGNELFLIFLYMYHFEPSRVVTILGTTFPVWALGAAATSPIFVGKQIISLIQLKGAVLHLASLDCQSELSSKAL